MDEPPFPVEVVRYEDFLSAPVATFGRALRAAASRRDDARLAGPSSAQASIASAGPSTTWFRERSTGAARFFRRGKAGSWQDELPAEVAAQLRQDHGEVMARFGYA